MSVYIRVTIGGGRFEAVTGRTLVEEKWSGIAGRMKGASIEAKEVNSFLDSLLGKAHAIQRQIVQEDLVMSIETFRMKWLGIAKKSVDLLKVFEEHNARINELVGSEYAHAT